MLNSYNVSYEANISKIGNAETLFIPKELTKLLHWEIGSKEKMRVKLCPNEQGEVVIKPINQWSAEKQTKAIEQFLKTVNETDPNDEPLPDNFEELYCYRELIKTANNVPEYYIPNMHKKWSAENQLKSGLKLLQVIKETKDPEPLPENFAEEFAYKGEDKVINN
jgi:antitoxin component of MazEF toxin-antitoxin module